MASPRDIRQLALLALYQFDSRAGEDSQSIHDSLGDVHTLEEEGLVFSDLKKDFTENQRQKAFDLARAAYEHREIADIELNELSTEWTVSRMPVVDRSILRMAHYEMTATVDPKPKAAVNEAVQLAKMFSTKNSPGFVNGILDKILKRVLAGADAAATE